MKLARLKRRRMQKESEYFANRKASSLLLVRAVEDLIDTGDAKAVTEFTDLPWDIHALNYAAYKNQFPMAFAIWSAHKEWNTDRAMAIAWVMGHKEFDNAAKSNGWRFRQPGFYEEYEFGAYAGADKQAEIEEFLQSTAPRGWTLGKNVRLSSED